jgi:hypothetical protein
VKGSLVHAIIASLEERERKKFLSSRPVVRDWEQLARLFRFLATQNAYSETELLKLIGQTKRQKNSQVEQLGQLLISFVGEGKPDVIVAQIIATAPKLIENRQDKQAIELIEWAIAMAEETENYQAIQALWRLAELFPDPRPKFKGMSYDHALACSANLVAYRQIEVKLRQAAFEGPEDRMRLIAELEAADLLDSPGMALGFEARTLYWRIKAICKFFVGNPQERIAPQKALVETLAERIDSDFEIARRWIKESGTLATFYSLAGNLEESKRLRDEIWDFPTQSTILQTEKTKQIYPAKINTAIDFGDRKLGDEACEEILSLIYNQPELVSTGLQCRSLYCCASYMIGVDRIDEAAKLLLKLRSYQRQDFMPVYYSMTKLLEIVVEIEREAFEDAIRLIKNIRMSKHDQTIAGFGVATQLLSAVTSTLCEPNANWRLIPTQANIKRTLVGLSNQPILKFFDLIDWVESRSAGIPMMDLVRQRISKPQ